jgi:hypothetical protein
MIPDIGTPATVIDVTPAPNGKLTRGGQRGNRNAEKHGSHQARRDMRTLLARSNDRRTREFRDWLERRAVYLPDLGGEETLSAMEQRTLGELVRVEQRIDALGAWLDAHPLVYGRGKNAQVVPVLRDHMRLTELAAHLRDKLGLKRRERAVQSLSEYLAARTLSAPEAAASPDQPDATGGAVTPASPITDATPSTDSNNQQTP